MTWVFWFCAAIVLYTYLGYPAVLFILARMRFLAIEKGTIEPTVSVLIAALNEEAAMQSKIENLVGLNYPQSKLQILIGSDGSTDQTVNLLLKAAPRITAVISPQRIGKSALLARMAAQATGEILVLMDVRQRIEPDALKALVRNFADPTVGCVSGELMFETHPDAKHSAVGLYWRLEKKVRQLESASGSVVGATGALYAVRAELYDPAPAGTILDDVYSPMQVAAAGKRLVFEPAARAWDFEAQEETHEFRRKIRTLTGNYQLIQICPWLVGPRNPLLFRFVSHKVLRLIVPYALLGVLVSAVAMGFHPLYGFAAVIQVIFYAFGALGTQNLPPFLLRIARMSSTFVLLNAAALLAGVNFILRRRSQWAGPTR